MNLGQWLSFLCLVIVLVFLWQIRQVLLLVFTAVVLAIALNAVARQLQKLGMSRGRAVLLTVSLSLLLAFLIFYLIVPPFVDQLLELGALVPVGFLRVVSWVETLLNNRPDWLTDVELPSPSRLIDEIQPFLRDVLPNFFAIFSGSLAVLLQGLLLIVFTLMLLANPLAYRYAVVQLFPAFYRERIDTVLGKCEVALGSWLGGALISSTVVALLSAIGLWALQIEFVLAQALLAGLLNFIPNIGPTLSMVFPLTVAALDAPWKVLAVLILYIVIQNLEAYLITPTIMANQVSLLPAMTLAAQLVFARFFGFLGLLLALPLAVIAKTFIQEILVKDILDQWRSPNHRNHRDDYPTNQQAKLHSAKSTAEVENPFKLPPDDLFHD
ncbi:MAG: AI-2E family transporter [Leptolyngbya sp. IPPAS B-1204]|uniref:AI-2E family transporter n=1 Tax=Leptolyngbya sp. NK1-12 TaxID=2547451 RepID=A0AA96WNN7_9CYAN|nr:AI-2E family transporter [Leptolyngbya sp. NK1-12]MBF2047066.1 AI-2E family transporter [Elainella sp. C42_A2020_010]RNJ69958.1 MAG: AI-2E family transporter [Leptolyngbya sp. IPPAS B-1204]WNZ25226.1 AI-2E family transporter [Leptolyngbya sp. NK1-12]